MKLKINKLLPYTQQNKKYKTISININNRNYYLSPHQLDKHNYVGIIIPLHFVCTMPDQNHDYQYLKCMIRVENNDFKETVAKGDKLYKDIKRNDGKRQFLFQFVPPYRGAYSIFIQMQYKQRLFIQSNQPVQEARQASTIKLQCQDPFQLQERIIYEQKPFSISFPLYVQYTITNRLQDDFLDLQTNFTSDYFDHKFLNDEKAIRLGGGQTYYVMVEFNYKPNINKVDILFGEHGLMIGNFWILQGKSKLQKKLFIRQGYKHLLFRGETVDKRVVKQDIVEVRVKFVNLYSIDYKIGPIKISIHQQDIPPGIKLLKISRDTIDLTNNKEQVVILTMICLRSGFFQFKGIVLNIKDKNDPKTQRVLKYSNDITFMVQNEKKQKQDDVMQKTTKIQIDSLI